MNRIKNETTEDQILDAANYIFQTKGMEGARMQEIADKAGINKSMLHYYYRSKQLLFEAVFKKAFALLAPQLNTILNDDSSIEDKIKNFTNDYLTFIIQYPYIPKFVIQELNRNPDFILKIQKKSGFSNITKFKEQLQHEINMGLIIPIKAEQLFINIMALNIFPFVAKPLVKAFTHINEESFEQLMEDRKTEVATFIINSIKQH